MDAVARAITRMLGRGTRVGVDHLGNEYFRAAAAAGGGGTGGRERRWVVPKDGKHDLAFVPPAEWHRWLHHGREDPPDEPPLAAAVEAEREARVDRENAMQRRTDRAIEQIFGDEPREPLQEVLRKARDATGKGPAAPGDKEQTKAEGWMPGGSS